MSGVSALIKGTPQSSPPFCQVRTQGEDAVCEPRGSPSLDPDLGLVASELRGINVCKIPLEWPEWTKPSCPRALRPKPNDVISQDGQPASKQQSPPVQAARQPGDSPGHCPSPAAAVRTPAARRGGLRLGGPATCPRFLRQRSAVTGLSPQPPASFLLSLGNESVYICLSGKAFWDVGSNPSFTDNRTR